MEGLQGEQFKVLLDEEAYPVFRSRFSIASPSKFTMLPSIADLTKPL